MENQNPNPSEKHNHTHQKGNGNLIGGLVLITLGILFLIDKFVPRVDFGDLWPVILVVAGIGLIINSFYKPKSDKK
jgi:phage shock protein C